MKKKLTIEEMHVLAKERGGKCLSTEYINSGTKLKWECAKGHTWYAIPSNVKWGTWCPMCGRGNRLTIKEMHVLAKERGGKCLSTEYINAHTKLKWQCAEGHTWEATPDGIKSVNSWCPVCANTRR